ncbi:retrovirus-related pol polyprotein from transposon TNT 1-94 [Tanacetum coccineum]
MDLTQDDTKTPSPKHQLPSPSAANAPSKTPSTKDTSSSSIDYIPKSPTSSTSPSTNGYLYSPTSPPLRVPSPPPIQESGSMDITLTLSTITQLDKGCHVLLAHIIEKKPKDKSEEKRLEDVPTVRDFLEVFPKDFPGLPPTRQVEFLIYLVPAPVAQAPYRLVPSEMKELSENERLMNIVRCYLLNDYDDVGKLKAKGDIGVFVGYSKESAAYRVYNKRTRKIHESVNVNFDEISEMVSKQFRMIALDDDGDDDVLDVPNLDSREQGATRLGLPAAWLATGKDPAARLALQPPGWAWDDVFRILFLT